MTTERWSRANSDLERRAARREAVLLPALVIESDGRRRPCVILDWSEGGLKISLPDGEPLPPEFAVVDLVTGVGREMAVAWRRADMVGLKTLAAYDLKAAQAGPAQRLRDIWVSVLG